MISLRRLAGLTPDLDRYLTTPPEAPVGPSGEATIDVYRPWPRSDKADGWLFLVGVRVKVDEGVASTRGHYQGVPLELTGLECEEAEARVWMEADRAADPRFRDFDDD